MPPTARQGVQAEGDNDLLGRCGYDCRVDDLVQYLGGDSGDDVTII